MGIQVLGPLTVDGSGRLGPRDRVVLQALTVRQGRSVTSDELADALWGDSPPASAHKNLQSCIVRLRKALGADAIETTGDGYRLRARADDVDAQRFEAEVARARELLALGEADRASFLLEKALELWRGRAFTDLAEWPPARRESDRLEELRRDAEELLLDAQLRGGHAREALPRAYEMVRAAPMRERRWELLALAQYRTGAQGEALRTIRQLRTVLARELGIDPAPEVAALEQSILRQDPSLRHDEASVAVAHLPVAGTPGLRRHRGRPVLRARGGDRDLPGRSSTAGPARPGRPLGVGQVVADAGGPGRSAPPARHGAGDDHPGPVPVQALSALSRVPPGDALFVDQAEELFTLCEDPDEARTFLDALVAEARRAARRGGAACRPPRRPDGPRRLQPARRARPLPRRRARGGRPPPGGDRPRPQAGLILEPGLVDLLVTEVRDDPGALPLLSHALLETWKRREGSTLTVDGYRASGGIHGAVAQSAERLYAQVEPDLREALRDLVLRLLSPGPEGEPVRTRVPRRLVGTDADARPADRDARRGAPRHQRRRRPGDHP